MIYALETTERTGHANLKERLIIKTFKDADQMHKFLTSPANDWNKWKISSRGLKAGKYAFAGGKYHNVKTLDASILAHI